MTPGFVDGHTHMDAQIFWDPIGTSSCFQGVTSVVMGNCGFTLAPCRESEADLVMRNLERAEDISRAAMKAGIKWRWETFPEFLDVLDTLPKGINYAGYMGHCALRTYVMGQRAFTDQATEDDLKAMVHHTKESIAAGAHGFSTTRSVSHMTSDDKPVASRLATWEEFETLVKAMGAGMVEVAGEPRGAEGDKARQYYEGLSKLAIESGRPITFGLFGRRSNPGSLAHHLRHHRAHRAAGRPHVRPGAQPGAERAAVLRDAAAVRQVGHVARHAQAAARPSRSSGCSTPTSAAAWSRSPRVPTKARWCAAPRRGRRNGTGSTP